jgi:hypothetical protein
MVTSNTDNIKRWLEQSDIDYFTCFVKAWIPFNAWYRNSYEALEQERQILDEIKTGDNRIRSRFIARLVSDDPEWQEVRNHIATLHRRLSLDPLFDRKKRRVSFENVLVGPNSQNFAEHKHGHWFYRVERTTKLQIDVTIKSNRGNVAAKFSQAAGWSVEDLESHADYSSLGAVDKERIKRCYEAANPHRFESLLEASPDSNEAISMNDYHFVSNKAAIFAGSIEILYSMRNLLFHGELVPDSQTNRTYEPAYHLLRHLIATID